MLKSAGRLLQATTLGPGGRLWLQLAPSRTLAMMIFTAHLPFRRTLSNPADRPPVPPFM